MSPAGALTARVGNDLEEWLGPRGFDVFYDHGPAKENVGETVSWFVLGPKRRTRLSQLDIMIVERSSGNVRFLIEIEETNNRPKNVLGDVYGALMGGQITFRKQRKRVGPWTTLIVVGKGSRSLNKRNEFLARRIKASQPALGTRNSTIGEVIVSSFENHADLRHGLRAHIEEDLKKRGG